MNIMRRTLKELGGIMAALFSSRESRTSSFSILEPRARIALTLVMLSGVTLMQSVWQLILLFAAALIIARMARVHARNLSAVWLGVPLFSLAIILPSLLNVITPGPAVLTIMRGGAHLGPLTLPCDITITGNGIIVASRFLLRALCCITFSAVLVASMGPGTLITALRHMGLPMIFGMVLVMMYRYLAIVIRVAEELHLSKLSRTLHAGTPGAGQRWAAASMVILFRKSYYLSGEVHHAMLSRGFDGDLQVGGLPALTWRDAGAVACALVFVVSLYFLDTGSTW